MSASVAQAGSQDAQGLSYRDGTIDVEVARATTVVMSLIGYWKTPTATDTGLGLHPLDAFDRKVDLTNGTATCNAWGRRREFLM